MRSIPSTQKQHQQGLTLVELVVVMMVMSVAVVGMGTSAVSIVGFYKNDWVTRNIRAYGFAAMDQIEDILEDADYVRVDPWSQYDRLYIRRPGITETTLIQGNKNEGLLKGVENVVKNYKFPNEGTFIEGTQRQVTLEGFHVQAMKDVNPVFNNRPALHRIGKSIYDVTLVFGLRTNDPEYGEIVEYTTMHRQIYVRRLYII